LVLPAPVAAEVDYLLGVRFGHAARRAFLSDLAAWRYDVACLEADDYRVVTELDARYSGLGLGLADCLIAVLAERYGTRRLFSFDERRFRAVAPLQGGSFSLLPAV
jgi:predicted nucleic acid-binding protein